MSTYRYVRPADIEKESMRIIEGELQDRGLQIPPENLTVVKRVIHTTADFDYGRNLKFTDRAAARAIEALQAGGRVIRTEEDTGVIALLDERFLYSQYRQLMPESWEPLKRTGLADVSGLVETFWTERT